MSMANKCDWIKKSLTNIVGGGEREGGRGKDGPKKSLKNRGELQLMPLF